MAGLFAGDVGRYLGRLFGAGSAVGLTDGELLERFAYRRDESAEAAFETILARHGAMVLAVCRQVLGDRHAAEDAFQATFLVLLRRAGSLRVRTPGSIGPWLHGVAYRIAIKAREGAARGRARECRAARPVVGRHSAAIEQAELQALLHGEIDRLPAKYRAPIVLCYFEGRTHDEAAAALRWPVGTVRGRLARAREQLRSRLTRRGVSPGGWVEASLLGRVPRIEPPAPLLEATVIAAIKGTPAAAVGAMASLWLRGLLLARLWMTAAALAVALVMAGFGLARRGAPAPQPGRRPDPAPAPVAAARPPSRPSNDSGDPLPKFARARLGDTRFHHGDDLRQALWTPDGKCLVAIDDGGLVRVWDAATGRMIRAIGDPSTRFWHIAVSPDGNSLATIEDPGQLRMWDLPSGRERRRWHAIAGSYRHLTFSPDGRTVAAGLSTFDEATKREEEAIILWDVGAPTEHRRRFGGNWLELTGLAFSPDGKSLVSGSNDTESRIIGEKPEKGSTRLWDLATGRERFRSSVGGCHVSSVAISPDGRLLAAARTDLTIRLYDPATGQERTLRLGPADALRVRQQQGLAIAPAGGGPAATMTCLAFSPDGSILASGSSGTGNTGSALLAHVYLWDVARGQELRHFPAHQGCIGSLNFSPDGRALASTGPELMLRLWDVATGREISPQSGHRSWIRKLVVSPIDGTVFTTGQDGTIRRWDPATGRELGIFARFTAPIDAMAFAPDGKTLFLGGSSGDLALWSVDQPREIRRFARVDERNDVHHVAFAPDGKTVASERRTWDAATGKVLVTFLDQDQQNNHFANFYPIFYTPDGRQIIRAELQGVRVWDIASGKEVRWVLRSERFHSYTIALSPDGRLLARGGMRAPVRGIEDPSIRLIEVASGQEVATLAGHDEGTRGLAFSPDGRLLASGSGSNTTSRDSTVRVWDTASGRELRRLEGHLAAVNAVVFTPDGRSIVSGSADATALVWDVADVNEQREDAPLTGEAIKARWDELASDDARAAYRATWMLSVPSAVAFLGEHLRPATLPDPKGIPAASGPIAPPDVLRTLRAIAALERVGTPEAGAVLEKMARGNPDAIPTRDARSARDRLWRRPRARVGA
jgi:RNA polymerase sigma factor (sigma-70 family)